jgi:hypothetical protein
MSFYEHQASYDLSFNSESHLRPAGNFRSGSVTGAPDVPDVTLQGYLAMVGMKN